MSFISSIYYIYEVPTFYLNFYLRNPIPHENYKLRESIDIYINIIHTHFCGKPFIETIETKNTISTPYFYHLQTPEISKKNKFAIFAQKNCKILDLTIYVYP